MGKQRRKRTSFHTSPTTRSSAGSLTPASQDNSRQDLSVDSLNTTPINFTVPDNLFANVNINFASIKKSLNDDTKSVKSYKSVKSEMSGDKALSKKDKLKLRKELLLQKIDTLNQQKKEAAQRSKRRNLAVIGETNSLLDALPSMESLMQNNKNKTTPALKGSKGIQTMAQRKRETIKNLQLYKTIKKNKKFISNPLQAISQHIRAVVEEETMKLKSVKPNK